MVSVAGVSKPQFPQTEARLYQSSDYFVERTSYLPQAKVVTLHIYQTTLTFRCKVCHAGEHIFYGGHLHSDLNLFVYQKSLSVWQHSMLVCIRNTKSIVHYSVLTAVFAFLYRTIDSGKNYGVQLVTFQIV